MRATPRTRYATLVSLTMVLGACGAASAGSTATEPDGGASPTFMPGHIDQPSTTQSVVETAAPDPAAPPVQASPPDPAPGGPSVGRACEDGLERVYELGALGTECDVAEGVAANFDTTVLAPGEVPDEPMQVGDGWMCTTTSTGMEEVVYVSCDQGDSSFLSVTFSWGV